MSLQDYKILDAWTLRSQTFAGQRRPRRNKRHYVEVADYDFRSSFCPLSIDFRNDEKGHDVSACEELCHPEIEDSVVTKLATVVKKNCRPFYLKIENDFLKHLGIISDFTSRCSSL